MLHKLISKVDELILHIEIQNYTSTFCTCIPVNFSLLIIEYLFEYFVLNVYTYFLFFIFLYIFFLNIVRGIKYSISSSPLIFINLINTFRFNFSYIFFILSLLLIYKNINRWNNYLWINIRILNYLKIREKEKLEKSKIY